jgi:hypothetical protein
MAQGGPKKEIQMNKPSKSEFQTIVSNYINEATTSAQVFDIVDNWTHYYKSKFWSVIQDMRANA